MRPKRGVFGLIGAGAIGGIILQAYEQGRLEYERAIVLLRRPASQITARIARVGGTIVHDVGGLIGERPEVVIEAAGHDAVQSYALPLIDSGISLILLSIGALVDDGLRESVQASARKHDAAVWLASGGIGGLDALAAAEAMGDLEAVIHRIVKHPDGLKSAPYIVQRGLLKEQPGGPVVIYQGSAREAMRHFPQNVNVAAAVSLAGIGFDRTKIEIVADPSTTRTVHEIQAEGHFGSFRLRFENVPDPGNPRTSRLAGLSAVAALRERQGAFRLA